MPRLPLAVPANLTAFGRDLGAGTAFPAAAPDGSALRRNDAYYHTTYGALFLWNGTGWRTRGPGELTAAQRIALVTANIPYAGFQVYETDTSRTYQWAGTAWVKLPGGIPESVYAHPNAGGTAASFTNTVYAAQKSVTLPAHAPGSLRIQAATLWNCGGGQALWTKLVIGSTDVPLSETRSHNNGVVGANVTALMEGCLADDGTSKTLSIQAKVEVATATNFSESTFRVWLL